jgi:hypothetical protein
VDLSASSSEFRRFLQIDPILTIFELQSGQFSLYLAPLTGAMFALVIFLTFLGQLVSGTVFPEIKGDLTAALHPYSANYGKLLVWSFIVGFAERFVPDTLNSLMARGQKAPVALLPDRGRVDVGNHTGVGVDTKGPAVKKTKKRGVTH